MKFMKKQILLFFGCLLLNFGYGQDKKLVLATASIFADMAENISGGLVDDMQVLHDSRVELLYYQTGTCTRTQSCR